MEVPHIVEPDIEQYRVLLLNIVSENINTRPGLGDRLTGINQPNDIINAAITDIVNGAQPFVREGPDGHHLNMIFDTIERMLDEIPQAPQAPQEQPADAAADAPADAAADAAAHAAAHAAADIGRNGGRRRYKTSKKSKKRATRRRRSSKRKSRKVNKRRN